jgi:cell division protein FtsQ
MPVTAPADKRFRRAHVKPARKRSGWRSWRWRLALAVLVLAIAGYAARRALGFVVGLQVFHVDHIFIRGNHRLSHGEAIALLHGLRGRSILAVDLEQWRRAMLNSPWVADAALRKTLPSTIDVIVQERSPLGIGRINGELYLIDDRGGVIDIYSPSYADIDLPIIEGLSSAPDEEAANVYRAILARRLLDALAGRKMDAQVSEIDVSDARNAIVLLEGDPTLIRLGDERFVERLQSYLELAPTLRDSVPEIDYVDLRFDGRVYVRPAKEGSAVPGDAKRARIKSGKGTQTG